MTGQGCVSVSSAPAPHAATRLGCGNIQQSRASCRWGHVQHFVPEINDSHKPQAKRRHAVMRALEDNQLMAG